MGPGGLVVRVDSVRLGWGCRVGEAPIPDLAMPGEFQITSKPSLALVIVRSLSECSSPRASRMRQVNMMDEDMPPTTSLRDSTDTPTRPIPASANQE